MIDRRNELERLRLVYEGRRNPVLAERYSRTNPGHLYSIHEREATMAVLLRLMGLKSLAGLRILDVGCGSGATLRPYLEYGAEPSRLWGVDAMLSFVQQARSISPDLRFVCGSAYELPFPDCSFDFVSQFTVFTSVLSTEMKFQIARELDRVLVPGGRFLWYDFAYNNPSNANVRGINLDEIRRLFPGFSLTSRKITLAPPLGRLVGRAGATMYYLLSSMRFLCTHYLCILEKH